MLAARFLKKTEVNTVHTTIINGKMIINKYTRTVRPGESYQIESFEKHNNGTMTIDFGNNLIKGVANNIRSARVEIRDTGNKPVPPPRKRGCCK